MDGFQKWHSLLKVEFFVGFWNVRTFGSIRGLLIIEKERRVGAELQDIYEIQLNINDKYDETEFQIRIINI